MDTVKLGSTAIRLLGVVTKYSNPAIPLSYAIDERKKYMLIADIGTINPFHKIGTIERFLEDEDEEQGGEEEEEEEVVGSFRLMSTGIAYIDALLEEEEITLGEAEKAFKVLQEWSLFANYMHCNTEDT